MKKGWIGRRAMVMAMLTCAIVTVFITSPTARACLGDAIGLVLTEGEIPGGG